MNLVNLRKSGTIMSYIFRNKTESHQTFNLLSILLITFFGVILLRTAWVSEDAYITFRTVDNFIGGYGLRWNIAERVQSFTHPLWMFCLSLIYLFTREFYYSVICFSFLLSIFGLYLYSSKIARNSVNLILGIMILVLSKAFIDYSTSGLENPLTHLIIILFLILFFKCDDEFLEKHSLSAIFFLSFLASLGALNRMDTILFFIPPMLYLILKGPEKIRKFRYALAGTFPFVLWEIFSLFYYGFLFPNTAYAKLNTGIHSSLLIEQGFYYLLNSLSWDPITLFVIVGVLTYVFFTYPKNSPDFLVGLGVLLYLVYIVKIGGGFMSGRFLTAPLFVSVILLGRVKLKPLSQGVPAILLISLLGFNGTSFTLLSNESYHNKKIDKKGIADERGFYYRRSGLLNANRSKNIFSYYKKHFDKKISESKNNTIVHRNIGFFGFYAGSKFHIIDNYGLSDPLLARLPIMFSQGKWRIGHFKRATPKGYEKSVRGKNVISDRHLSRYWDKLHTITRGDLFSWDRLVKIWNINAGRYDHLIKKYWKKNMHNYPVTRFNKVKKEGIPWNQPGNYFINDYGIGIRISPSKLKSDMFSISLNGGEIYRMVYYRKGKEIVDQILEIPEFSRGGLKLYQGTFPKKAVEEKFDMIRIYPASFRGKHSMGHFQLIEESPDISAKQP